MTTTSTPYCSVAIAGLATFNSQFDHFVAEMHLDNSGTKLADAMHIKGVWAPANKDYEQTSVEFFRGALVGTTYYFRAAVADKQGNLSPYTSFVAFTPGSATAPNPTYTPVVTASSGGLQINVGPSSMTNVEFFEGYWNLTGTAPATTQQPNLPPSNDGTSWAINVASGQTGYIWARAVDANGNRQAWTQLGGTGVGFQSQDGSVFKVPPGTLDGVPDGTGTAPRRALPVAPIAQRPTAGSAGRLFHATDQGVNGITYRDTGSAWLQVAAGQLGDLPDGTSRFARTAVHSSHAPTSNPLTGHDAGSNVTINIAAHTMQVGGTAVSNNSGSVTALSYSTLYYVYYDDPTLTGGAVSYQATTTKTTAINGAGRFFVGSILTPKATALDTNGNGDGGTGAQVGTLYKFMFNATSTSFGGDGAVANPSNAIDGDPTTFSGSNCTATATSDFAQLTVSGAPGIVTGRAQTITLKTISAVSLTGTTGAMSGILSYSTDGGVTFTNIYASSVARAKQIDSVALPFVINPGLIQVRARFQCNTAGNKSGEIDLYETWIEIQE